MLVELSKGLFMGESRAYCPTLAPNLIRQHVICLQRIASTISTQAHRSRETEKGRYIHRRRRSARLVVLAGPTARDTRVGKQHV
jgi:hypothetical protein